ncbi:MAG: tetratricopeptide repeat protein [Candidatus Krumholzibacteriota bacterium]|nr:tetratricopeptide repeat protein [Candidatus Krumholzibacteriota bacterium]
MFIDGFAGFMPKSHLKKALAYLNKGEYKKACREFESHLSRKDGEVGGKDQELLRMYIVEAYMEYSIELEKDGKFNESARELEKAIELQPRYADVHYRLGMMYETGGNRINARESIKRALAINPNYFKARIMLARSYYSDGNFNRTIEQLRESLSSVPNFFKSHLNTLILKVKADEEEDEILNLFDRLLEERPSSSQISKQIALESIQSGDYESAMAEMKKALSLNPDYPDLHNLLGIAYANAGMIDDAMMEFETALKINPEYLKARMNIALTLYEKGSAEEAIKHLKLILKADPANELAINLYDELQPEPSKR